jgi:predicted CopG family antitoxin
MAVKTITIDMDAYNLLSRQKAAGQSFSDVIKAHFTPTPTAGRFRGMLKTLPRMDEETLDRIDDVIQSRRNSPARYEPL